MTEHEALAAINMVAGIGAITARKLARRMGSFAAIFQAPESELAEVNGIGPEKARAFAAAFANADPGPELERAKKWGVQIITLADPEYPAQLKQIAEPPLALYLRGKAEILGRPCVAIVGTRHPTVYGRETARLFGGQLASMGYTVVSGLACGIDAESHIGALATNGATAGIIGGALDKFYPNENLGLARKMVEKGGAVVSEYPFGRAPDRQTFPMRNRIVSGLCRGVVVVEAPFGSGTLITAKWAEEQDRAVMAVPGRIDSPASKGALRLLRDGARLVTSAADVAEELDGGAAPMAAREPAAAAPARPVPQMSGDERKVLALLDGEGLSTDEIVRASGLSTGSVSSILIKLQIKRLARALPGGRVAQARQQD